MKELLALQAKGAKVPSLENKPQLFRPLDPMMSMFDEMSHDRRYTQGFPLRLTTTDIKTYWDVFVGVEFEHFYLMMRLLDREWHTAFSNKQSAGAKP